MRLYRWFENTCEVYPDGPSETPPTNFWAFLWYYSKPFKRLIILGAVLSGVTAVVEVYLFSFVGSLVDWLNTADRAAFWEVHGTALSIVGAVVLVFNPLLNFAYEVVVHQGLMGNFAMRTRWQIHRYLLRQSVAFFQDDFAGRVATKMMQTSLDVRDTVNRFFSVFLYVGVYFTGAMVLFASSDLRLTAPMFLWLIGYLITLWMFVPQMARVSKEQADARSMVTGRVVDSYTNINTVKMFADAGDEDDYARAGMDVFLDSVYRQMRLSTNMISLLYVLNGGLLFSVAAMSLWLWSVEAVSVGAIAFALALVLRLRGMSQWILWEVSVLFESVGVVRDGIETISREQAVVDVANARVLSVPHGEITYNDILFNYGKERDDGRHGVIDGLSLTIKPGEKIGLVGRSGAGKSTLVNLLLRFYDVDGGALLIDGQDISAVTQESLRTQIGMVTQDTSLLHRSVRDNIRYGSPQATEDDIVDAAKNAHAHDFILGLEDMNGRTGYDAHVGERGVKLSGGQRQRIAIARVLLKDAPILILDEATSALDSEVEAAIQESLYILMKGKTVIAIAHRLSTIAAMDRLIIMDHGRIVEDGTHTSLLEQGGLYAELWARQSGGFLAYDAEETAAE